MPSAEALMTQPTSTRPLTRRRPRACFALAIVVALATAQELAFRAMFPLPEVAGFNRVRYQMMAGAHSGFVAAVRRGLVYDRLLFESQPDGFSEIHRLNRYGF